MEILNKLWGLYLMWSVIVMCCPELIPDQDGSKKTALTSLFISGVAGWIIFAFCSVCILFKKREHKL